MSLFGALFSGVSGLQSQSSAMGAIADNVTNVNTIGYKATTVNFKTLITAQTSLTQYSPGGVQSSPRQGVDIQGLLQATTSSTDVGISGEGFFVTNASAPAGPNDLFTYTRAGSFKVDQNGFLQNVGGGYMEGWPLYQDNPDITNAKRVVANGQTYMKSYINSAGEQVIINDNVIDNTNLQPLNLQTIGGTATSTSTLSIGANLPSGANLLDQEKVNAQIFDSLGNPGNLAYNFVKTGANQWSATVQPPAQVASIEQLTQDGEVYYAGGRIDFNPTGTPPLTGSFDFNVNGGSFTINLDNTSSVTTPGSGTVATLGRSISQIVSDVADEVNTAMENQYGVAGPQPEGRWARAISGENALTFDQASTTDMTFGVTPGNPVVDANGKPMVYQNDTSQYYTVKGLSGPDANGDIHTWYDLAGVIGGTGTAQRGVPAIEFAGNGTPQKFFGRTVDEAPSSKANIEMQWVNGSAPMGNDLAPTGSKPVPPIQVFLGNYGTPDGITQLSGDFQLNYLQQNGAKFGNFSGVTIGKDGIVTALFDNGVTRPIFMIPLASFTNPNGLSSLSGNSWIATDASGNPTLRQAGDAGAGSVNAATLEASTVDLGTEFTRMITTQRAYSSAAKVITTSDDMLSELLNIKR